MNPPTAPTRTISRPPGSAAPSLASPESLCALLTQWANLNSGSDHLAGLERMRTVLAEAFATLPAAQLETVPLARTEARGLRVTVRPEAPRQILLSGHFDTVYDANHGFQQCTRLDADTLRGPGVADMKGGIVVMLAALHAFEHSPAARQVGYDVLLTPDEETGSVASRAVYEAAAASRRFAFALVFEPARVNGNLVRARAGTGIFTLTCYGRAAHAGRDSEAGRNAIVALAEYLTRVDALNRELPGVLLNIGRIRGGGAVNIVPDRASADVNIRITRVADADRVLERLHQLAAPINARDGFRLELTGRFNRLPKEINALEEQLFHHWQQCGRDLGVEFSWHDVAGGSDANLLSAAGLPCLDGLGPVGGATHSAEEFVRVSSLAERANVAARFFEKLATGEIIPPSVAANPSI